ncbi:hypothetical protein C6B38_02350 [Spiroplasma sp. ChiS]|uniref:hypothetical protein n=1 Tax=Spiroplasma sp. ChiS TaxID=2099885 RepID=UPI000CF9C513|nr:hypothetical protein [Spiroplasma sp. ChiS]PQP79100.1 hypothetical protein C6B38_02350 [Spiroplasma sp. ChiS]
MINAYEKNVILTPKKGLCLFSINDKRYILQVIATTEEIKVIETQEDINNLGKEIYFMEKKQSNWTTVNIMARRKLKCETEKAVLFSIPKHKGLSVWISKKCIHGSRSGKSLVVGIKSTDEYIIWLYDNDAKIHIKSEIWQGQFFKISHSIF